MVGLPKQFIEDVTQLSDRTIARFDLIRGQSRYELAKRLAVLAVATFAAPIATKNLIPQAFIRYRPVVNLGMNVAITIAAFGLKDLVTYRNYGQRGLEVAKEINIETIAENLIQQPGQANYAPHNGHNQSRQDAIADAALIEALPPEIPTEDIAEALAQNTTGTLIIAPSGCGKTTLVRAAMNNVDRIHQGKQDFTIIDCKGDEDGWLGIEKDSSRFILLDDDSAIAGLDRLDQIKGQLKYNRQYPLIAIIDEWNNGISSIENSVEVESATKAKKAAKSSARQIVTKGRSKKILGWMTTHTPETQSIGMDSATRQSLDIIILARKSKLGLLNQILQGKGYDFVDDVETRDRLFEQFTYYRKSPNFNPEVPIALTNLGGTWRLAKLPHYSIQPLQYWTGKAQQLIESDIDEGWEDEDDFEDEPIDTHRANKAMPSAKIIIENSEVDLINDGEFKQIYKNWKNSPKSKSDFIKGGLGLPEKKYEGAKYSIGKEILDRAIHLASKYGWDNPDSARNT